MSILHSQATGIHPGAYIQSTDPVTTDPTAVVAKVLWLDTTLGYVLKCRNDSNDAWTTVFNFDAFNLFDYKSSVRAATTANITLSGAQTIDGVSIIAGDRVLVKAQSTGSQNGIYVAAAGAWARAADADSSGEVTAGMVVPVSEGTVNADTFWILNTNDSIVLGTTSLSFTQIGSTVSIAPLVLEDANTVSQRNNTNAQTTNFYRTYTDGSNNRRLSIISDANNMIVGAYGVGTGGDPHLLVRADSNVRIAPADNDAAYYEFGSGSVLPRTNGGENLGGTSNKWGIGYANEWQAANRIKFISSSGIEPTNAGSIGPTDSSNNPGTFSFRPTSPSQITSNQNDYNPGNSYWHRLSSDASRNITGWSANFGSSTSGQIHLITNVGSNDIVFKHQDTNSSASNRFVNSTGADITLSAGEWLQIIWDVITDRWRVSKLGGTITAASVSNNLKDSAISFVIDGGGATITTGIKGDLQIPFDCTILSATLLADQSGSIVIDVWKDTYANFPPVDADSITASAPPTISSATKSQDSTLTGWNTTLTSGDILRFNVDSVTTIQRVTLVIKVRKS